MMDFFSKYDQIHNFPWIITMDFLCYLCASQSIEFGADLPQKIIGFVVFAEN